MRALETWFRSAHRVFVTVDTAGPIIVNMSMSKDGKENTAEAKKNVDNIIHNIGQIPLALFGCVGDEIFEGSKSG